MNIADLTIRVEQLIKQGQSVLSTSRVTNRIKHVDSGQMAGFRSAALSFIERVYGKDHTHYTQFKETTGGIFSRHTDSGIAILSAIHDELIGGWLFSVKSLVTAELFADFLEMAEHLLSNKYKDPAAVMIGSVLEENLRQLCLKNNLPVEEIKKEKPVAIKADRLNSELCKAEVYTKLDQKSVTAWLDLRNNAAHGNYNEYNQIQVENMMSGVREFLTRISI